MTPAAAGFVASCRTLGATSSEHETISAAARLEESWSAPDRGYHTMEHLGEVLDNLAELGAATAELVLAAWFHDAVYRGRPGEDERASAALATSVLTGLGVDATAVRRVADLVLVTIDHVPAPDDEAAAALCDADLAVLASPPARYSAYVAGVRREFRHLDEPDFAAGRTAVLRGLAERPTLFRTDVGRRLWEVAARRNMDQEMDR